jgi:hypothetical protein
MQTFTVAIEAEGALIDVLVGLAAKDLLAFRNAGRPIPAPVAVRALIDTGAEASCAEPQVLLPLVAAGIPPSRFVIANVPALGGVLPAGEYRITLTVMHPSNNPGANWVLRNQAVVEQPLGQLGYQVLIGRDILDRCLHVYNGPARQFTLVY